MFQKLYLKNFKNMKNKNRIYFSEEKKGGMIDSDKN